MSMLAYVAATVVLVVCLRRATTKRLPLVSQPYLHILDMLYMSPIGPYSNGRAI